MTNEEIFKQAVDVSIRLAKAKWGHAPARGCMWIDDNSCVYTNKPKGIKSHPSEERWHQELKKYIEQFI